MLTTSIVLFMAVLLAIGTPVGLAMAAAGAAGLYAMGGTGLMLGILETSPFSAASSYELITIPMFLLMAEFVILRSEEHTSELQSLMRISYAVFCLKKKKQI